MIGFCAVLPQPTGTANYCKRVSRLVILPDYQGLGVGTRFLDAICKMYVSQGYKMYIRSAHIRLAKYWEKNPCWRPTARCGKKGAISKGKINGKNQNLYVVNRDCYSYEYVGADYLKPHMEVVVDSLDNLRQSDMTSWIARMKKTHYLVIVHNKVQNESWLNSICKKMGVRTELLYIHGSLSKKRIGCLKLVGMKNGNPVYGKVAA